MLGWGVLILSCTQVHSWLRQFCETSTRSAYGPKLLGRFELVDDSARGTVSIPLSLNARGKGKKDIMFRRPHPPGAPELSDY